MVTHLLQNQVVHHKMAKARKGIVKSQNPIKYAHVVEFGSRDGSVPPRPLFEKTLEEYTAMFYKKIMKVGDDILRAWS